MSHNQDACGLTLGCVLSTDVAQTGNDQLCLGWFSKCIPGDELCDLGFENRAGVHQAAGNTEGERKDVLGKRQGSMSDNLANPEKGHQEHI